MKGLEETHSFIIESTSVFVFEIRQWMICPRQLYFEKRQPSVYEKKENKKESSRRFTLYETDPARFFEKEIMTDVCFELPAFVLESADKYGADFINKEKLRAKIENAVEESKNCRLLLDSDLPETGKTEIEKAAAKSKSGADKIIGNISKTIGTYGFELQESAADPFAEDKLFHFSKIGLYGAPKKVITVGEKLAPYIIRITEPPRNGVWESDRMTAAAYSLILESEFGKNSVWDKAVIDYMGDFRVLQIRYSDKKKVFRAVRKIKDIKTGHMPSEKNIRLCEKCRFKEMCRPKAKTLFSRFFGKG